MHILCMVIAVYDYIIILTLNSLFFTKFRSLNIKNKKKLSFNKYKNFCIA